MSRIIVPRRELVIPQRHKQRGFICLPAGMGLGGPKGGGDPYWANVAALLHFDGADASTTFTDQTGKTWTASGNAQLDTAQSKFGGASLLLDGSGDYASTPNGTAFQMGSGDFTVEAWVRRNGVGVIMGNWRGSIPEMCGWLLNVDASGKLNLSTGVGTSNVAHTSATTVPSGVFSHVAAVRSGTSIFLFIDGVKDANTYTRTGALNHEPSEPVSIGAVQISTSPAAFFTGHIDEVRITKGVARYTADFTPPTAAFPHS